MEGPMQNKGRMVRERAASKLTSSSRILVCSRNALPSYYIPLVSHKSCIITDSLYDVNSRVRKSVLKARLWASDAGTGG